MKNAIHVVIALIFLAPLLVFAEPMPRGIAINNVTKECTGFNGGDEFTIITLPSGWDEYYPGGIDANNPNKDPNIIATEYGSCDFTDGDEEQCCTQLKLNYKKDVKKKTTSINLVLDQNSEDSKDFPSKPVLIIALSSAILFISLITVLLVILIKRKRNKNIRS